MFARATSLAFALAFASSLTSQRIALPHGTGSLTHGAAWTALGADDIRAERRATDPTGEPAHTQLRALLGELAQRDRAGEHVVLHMPGAVPGTQRSVNAYSAVARTTGDALLADATVTAMRDAYQAELSKAPGSTTFTGHEDPQLFATGALRLRFELDQQGLRTVLWHVTVPSGDRVQYFECAFDGRDADAPLVLAELLRTYDGARDASPSMLPAMLLGGGLGGLLGVLMGRWRKRKLANQTA